MEATSPTLVQKLSAEAIGTAVLVLFGVGSAMFGDGSYASIGLSFGIAIVAMVYAFGRVSGGHFNPAVSVGAALSGRIPWKDAGLYSAAQVVGAIVGAALLALVLLTGDTSWDLGEPLGSNGFGDEGGVDLIGALVIELVMTLIFVLVILAVTDERNEHPALAPLAIGLTLAAIHFASLGATATSVNPARSIGPGLFSGTDAILQLWLFIVAPLLGAAAAGFLYPAVFGRVSEPVPGSGLSFAARRAAAAPAVPGYGMPDQFQQQWNQQQPGFQQAGYDQGGFAQGGYPQGGYQQPGAVAPAAAAAAAPAAPHEQPIIQDGWQWDPQSQQWIPARAAARGPRRPGRPGRPRQLARPRRRVDGGPPDRVSSDPEGRC